MTESPSTEQLIVAALPRRRQSLVKAAIDGWSLLAIPVVLFLGVVFVIPLVIVLSKSLTEPGLGLQHYIRFFSEPLYLKVLGTTFSTAFFVTLVVVAISYPYAYLMTIVSAPVRIILLLVVLVPFWTSLLVRSFSLLVLLRDTGVVNQTLIAIGLIDEPIALVRNSLGVLIGMSQILLPFTVLPIFAAMRNVDGNLRKAAEGLGARPAVAFWRVYAPLTLPGVVAGALLCFVQVLGYYITPALLGGPQNIMLGELIVQQVSGVLNWGFAGALATILLASTMILLLIASRFIDIKRVLGGKW